jgi:hypothetical protein
MEVDVMCVDHRFQHPPGVGQNIAWALTEELNISRIIDDLWYRDIRLVREIFGRFFLKQLNPNLDVLLDGLFRMAC